MTNRIGRRKLPILLGRNMPAFVGYRRPAAKIPIAYLRKRTDSASQHDTRNSRVVLFPPSLLSLAETFSPNFRIVFLCFFVLAVSSATRPFIWRLSTGPNNFLEKKPAHLPGIYPCATDWKNWFNRSLSRAQSATRAIVPVSRECLADEKGEQDGGIPVGLDGPSFQPNLSP